MYRIQLATPLVADSGGPMCTTYMPNTASARARSTPTRRPIEGPGEACAVDSGEVRCCGGEFFCGAEVSCGGCISEMRRTPRGRQEPPHPAIFGTGPADRR